MQRQHAAVHHVALPLIDDERVGHVPAEEEQILFRQLGVFAGGATLLAPGVASPVGRPNRAKVTLPFGLRRLGLDGNRLEQRSRDCKPLQVVQI